MDIIDQANDLIERELSARLALRKNNTLKPIGECHNCGAELANERTFCDADCRDDFDRRQRMQGRRP